MRYKVDASGYVVSVAFGCYLNGCEEYTGKVPIGYSSLDDWATYSCIQAYYIDDNGNLALDQEKLAECRRKEAQDKLDNTPLLRKDLYGSDEVLDSQYLKKTVRGKLLTIEDAKTIAPRVKITGIKNYDYTELCIYTQGENMLPYDAPTRIQEVSGVTFEECDGEIVIYGTANEDVEYTISGSEENTTPLFCLKAGQDYYLDLNGVDCEMRYFDGETTKQQYVGASGLLNLSQDIVVTQVLLKFASGTRVDNWVIPHLEVGNEWTTVEKHKRKSLTIDLREVLLQLPSEFSYPSKSAYPNYSSETIEYVLIENGVIYACVGGIEKAIGTGSLGLFSGYDIVYALQDVTLEITYSTSVYDVDSLEFLQGKETTTKRFRILEDGSIEANNSYFSGTVHATDGEFTGTVHATDGEFDGKVTTNDLTVTGGSINLGNGKFNVTKEGEMSCTGATVEGILKAGEYSSIGDFAVDNNSVFAGSWTSSATPDVFMCTGSIGPNYSLGGSPAMKGWVFGAGKNFGVTKDGALYSKSGKIGGWTIEDGRLSSVLSNGDEIALYPHLIQYVDNTAKQTYAVSWKDAVKYLQNNA